MGGVHWCAVLFTAQSDLLHHCWPALQCVSGLPNAVQLVLQVRQLHHLRQINCSAVYILLICRVLAGEHCTVFPGGTKHVFDSHSKVCFVVCSHLLPCPALCSI